MPSLTSHQCFHVDWPERTLAAPLGSGRPERSAPRGARLIEQVDWAPGVDGPQRRHGGGKEAAPTLLGAATQRGRAQRRRLARLHWLTKWINLRPPPLYLCVCVHSNGTRAEPTRRRLAYFHLCHSNHFIGASTELANNNSQQLRAPPPR